MQNPEKRKNPAGEAVGRQAKKRQQNLLLLPLFLILVVIAAGIVLLNARQRNLSAQGEELPPMGEDSPLSDTPLPTELQNLEDSDATIIEFLPTLTASPVPTPTPTPTPEPVYVQTIPENALLGMEPDPEGYHESMDTQELAAFLQREEVQKLIGSRKLLWNADIKRFPDSPLRWYFDETILCIVWQEVEAEAVGTFSEIIIADGSQLRRKIAGDTFQDFHFETTSQFAQDTNAVLAFGGDFYHHGRACGIVFYQRQMYRFDPVTCDTCYITADGDMLFSYRNQFSDQAEAVEFASEHNVLFSLGFGPVLIDEYEDVTPETYPWGEVTDTYARSALGMFEERHYLTMNLNCADPGTPYYNLATLRQEADAMVARGCRKAYALDGGQTATTVFGGSLINPVQFGWEKEISDIIYFASAKGGERKELPAVF